MEMEAREGEDGFNGCGDLCGVARVASVDVVL